MMFRIPIKHGIMLFPNFFSRKKDEGEEKYIKELIKLVEKDSEKKSYYSHKPIEDYFKKEKLKKSDEEKTIDFQRRRIEALFSIKDECPDSIKNPHLLDIDKGKYIEKVKEISKRFNPNSWISEAAKNAESVSFATHVSKLTHSKIDTPSIYDQIASRESGYITTSSLGEKAIDGAVSGNQFAPIFQFLELECGGVKLAAELANPDSDVLSAFSQGEEHLEWNKGFGKALVAGNPASHVLAKQVYFPVINVGDMRNYQYHLLCNMKSSSMAQAIFEGLFSEEAKGNQKLFQDRKFSDSENRYFPMKGKISVTASNHSNASQLNGRRGGRLYLFSSSPPVWQSQAKPPIYQKSFFDAKLRHNISNDDLNYLRDFLIRFDLIDMSIQHPEKRKWINAWVGRIIEDLLACATTIQNMESGWTATEDIRLKQEHQWFLDPYRDDEVFQAERKSSNWQSVVCEDFARWLNWVLVGKDKQFSPQREHTRMWIAMMENPLREHDDLIKMEIKAGKVNA